MAVTRWALTDAQNFVRYIVESNGPPALLPAGIAAARPADGVAVNTGDTFDGVSVTPRVPTPNETADANAASLKQKGFAAFASNQTFLAIVSPTQGQTLAQVQSLTKQVNALLKLATGLLQDTNGT